MVELANHKIPRQASNVADVQDPSTLEEALAGPNAAEWKSAVIAEYVTHMSNGTWIIVNKLGNGRQLERVLS